MKSRKKIDDADWIKVTVGLFPNIRAELVLSIWNHLKMLNWKPDAEINKERTR